MDFNHTEERQMLVDTLARYLQNEYSITARNVAARSPQGFDSKQWLALTELGILGAFFTEEEGGYGGSAFDIIAVFEELGKALCVEPLLDCGLLPGRLLASAGMQDALAEIIEGTRRLAVALGEPGAPGLSVTARETEDGWVLNGTLSMVKFAQGTDAVIVAAQSGSDASAVSLFVVDLDAAGVTIETYETFDGGSFSDLDFNAVSIATGALVGPFHAASPLITSAQSTACMAICAEALGIMEAIKILTLDYLRTRSQFGTVIGKFQALQHRMAQILLEIEQARSAVINAAAAQDAAPDIRDRAVAAAKYSIGRIGTLVAEEAIQLHGGIGMTWEYDLGHYAKRLVMIDHELGDADHHLARFMQIHGA